MRSRDLLRCGAVLFGGALNWFRVDADLIDHPKTFALETELRDPKAGWYLIRIWAWLTRYAQHGQIEGDRVSHLESAAKWAGESGKLVHALVKTGWLDVQTGGALEAHDWGEKQGKMFEKAEKDRERKRISRKTARAGPRDGAKTARVRNERTNETYVTDEQTTSVEQARPVPLSLEIVEPPKRDDAAEVFEYWKAVMGSGRSVLDSKRRKLIEARIVEGATTQELKRAIDGCKASAFHQGENDRRTKYSTIELICRDRAKVEQFVALIERPVAAKPGQPGYWTEEESSGELRGEEQPW